MCLHEVDQEFAALAVVRARVLAEAAVIRLVREVATSSWLGLPHHGKGFGTEARLALLTLAFDHLGAEAAGLADLRPSSSWSSLVVRARKPPATVEKMESNIAGWNGSSPPSSSVLRRIPRLSGWKMRPASPPTWCSTGCRCSASGLASAQRPRRRATSMARRNFTRTSKRWQ